MIIIFVCEGKMYRPRLADSDVILMFRVSDSERVLVRCV